MVSSLDPFPDIKLANLANDRQNAADSQNSPLEATNFSPSLSSSACDRPHERTYQPGLQLDEWRELRGVGSC